MKKTGFLVVALIILFISVWFSFSVVSPQILPPTSKNIDQRLVFFLDKNKNGIVDADEKEIYEAQKLGVFDLNRNGVLEADELNDFGFLNDKLLSGGGELDKLDARQRDLYKSWRDFLLSLKLENKDAMPGGAGDLAKCYPDKVCDDPASANYNPTGAIPPPGPFGPFVELNIFYAAGLNAAIQELIVEFEKTHPGMRIIAESSGSVLAVRKITELNRKADLILVADDLLIKDKLIPQYADWYIRFYKDRIVIAYTDRSKYTNEIDAENWYKILLKKDVRYGYADPKMAPVGYRTLLAWQLTDLYYKEKINNKKISLSLIENCPKENILPDVEELLHVLESLSLDYVFVYESIAKQHNLKYINLPEEVDLGNPDLAELYKKAKIEITSDKSGEKKTIAGSPITFAFTIFKEASNFSQAMEFAEFLLGPQGQQIFGRNDQRLMSPCFAYNPEKIPQMLKQYVVSEGNK